MKSDPAYRKKYQEEQARQKELDNQRREERELNNKLSLSANEKNQLRDKVESLIKTHLKYPNDADFGWMLWEEMDKKPNGNNKRYIMVSEVKAMNGFGAKITMKIRALAISELKDGKVTYGLMSVDLDGKSIYTSTN